MIERVIVYALQRKHRRLDALGAKGALRHGGQHACYWDRRKGLWRVLVRWEDTLEFQTTVYIIQKAAP